MVNQREILTYEEILAFVSVLKDNFGLSRVRVTGGEPLVRKDVADLIGMLRAAGVTDIALTTNGRLLSNMAEKLARSGLKRVNVSVDSVDPGTYGRLTGGADLAPVLDGIDAARDAGLSPIKINTVVIRRMNDGEVINIARWCLERRCEVRFLELMPVGPNARVFNDWFVPSDEIRKKLAPAFSMKPVRSGSNGSSRDYAVSDGYGLKGTIGFISSYSSPFCDGCFRLRLTTTGKLLGCLACSEAIYIKPLMRNNSSPDTPRLIEAVNNAFTLKHRSRRFESQAPMVSFGG